MQKVSHGSNGAASFSVWVRVFSARVQPALIVVVLKAFPTTFKEDHVHPSVSSVSASCAVCPVKI